MSTTTQRTATALLALGAVALVVISDPRTSSSYCAGRLQVKTLSDRDQTKVKPTPIATRIERLRALPRPYLVELRERTSPVETTTFAVRARLVAMKRGPKATIELVVAASAGEAETMVVAFEDRPCGGWETSKTTRLMRQARSALIAACGAPARRLTPLAGTAEMVGIGFFGGRRQPGAAPNGIELHPALGFRRAACRRHSDAQGHR
jgi:hypothetical protein